MNQSEKREMFRPNPRRLGLLNQWRLIATGGLGFGLLVCCGMLLLSLKMGLKDLWLDWTAFHRAELTQGSVRYLNTTGWSFNDYEQFNVGFSYQVAGQSYNGFSYMTGYQVDEGDTVEVEYLAKNPALARIRGLDYSQFHFMILMPLMVGVLAAVGSLFGLRSVFRRARLLVHGELTEARLLTKQDTDMKINEQKVYDLTFQYKDHRGASHPFTVTTHVTENILDDSVELGLYDPNKPENFLLVDKLPFDLKLSEPGVWAQSGSTGYILFRLGLLVAMMGWTVSELAKL